MRKRKMSNMLENDQKKHAKLPKKKNISFLKLEWNSHSSGNMCTHIYKCTFTCIYNSKRNPQT